MQQSRLGVQCYCAPYQPLPGFFAACPCGMCFWALPVCAAAVLNVVASSGGMARPSATRTKCAIKTRGSPGDRHSMGSSCWAFGSCSVLVDLFVATKTVFARVAHCARQWAGSPVCDAMPVCIRQAFEAVRRILSMPTRFAPCAVCCAPLFQHASPVWPHASTAQHVVWR
jgi:hypothetical protein